MTKTMITAALVLTLAGGTAMAADTMTDYGRLTSPERIAEAPMPEQGGWRGVIDAGYLYKSFSGNGKLDGVTTHNIAVMGGVQGDLAPGFGVKARIGADLKVSGGEDHQVVDTHEAKVLMFNKDNHKEVYMDTFKGETTLDKELAGVTPKADLMATTTFGAFEISAGVTASYERFHIKKEKTFADAREKQDGYMSNFAYAEVHKPVDVYAKSPDGLTPFTAHTVEVDETKSSVYLGPKVELAYKVQDNLTLKADAAYEFPIGGDLEDRKLSAGAGLSWKF